MTNPYQPANLPAMSNDRFAEIATLLTDAREGFSPWAVALTRELYCEIDRLRRRVAGARDEAIQRASDTVLTAHVISFPEERDQIIRMIDALKGEW